MYEKFGNVVFALFVFEKDRLLFNIDSSMNLEQFPGYSNCVEHENHKRSNAWSEKFFNILMEMNIF